MTEATEKAETIEYKGQIFPSKISMQAWAIVARLCPDKTKTEERLGLAIAAQIGLNHDMPVPIADSNLRKKLSKIQAVLDGEI